MFVIKIKTINLENDEIMIFYQGRDGDIRNNPYFCQPWQKKAYAKKKIAKKIRAIEYLYSYQIVCKNCYFHKNESDKMLVTILNIINV